MKKTETVQEYLARGGAITVLPTKHSADVTVDKTPAQLARLILMYKGELDKDEIKFAEGVVRSTSTTVAKSAHRRLSGLYNRIMSAAFEGQGDV